MKLKPIETWDRRYRWRQKKRDQGLCTVCGKPVEEGRVTCRVCLDKQAVRNKKIYYERKENRLCVQCGLPLTELEKGQSVHERGFCRPHNNEH